MSKILEMNCPICDEVTFTDLDLYPNKQKFGLYEICANEECGGTFAFDIEMVEIANPYKIRLSS